MTVRGSMDLVLHDGVATVPPGLGGVLGQLRAAPFAQGYKATTMSGGRLLGGGAIRKVTNLNDSGAGSLRAALSTPGPADVVFEVAGIIPVATNLLVGAYGVESNITVWGETAPSPGVTISQTAGFVIGSGPGFETKGRNVVYRHLRFRMNAALDGTTFQQVISQNNSLSGSQRLAYHNCSFAYNADEMVGCAGTGPADISFYRCIFGPASGVQNKALLMSPWDINTLPYPLQHAIIQCIFGLTKDRNPNFESGNQFVMYNNYHYATGAVVAPGCFNGYTIAGGGGLPFSPRVIVSFRGNRHDGNAGVDQPNFEYDMSLTNTSPHHMDYWDDNVGWTRCVEPPVVMDAQAHETDLAMVLPEVGPSLVFPSTSTKSNAITNSGARPLDRDTVDAGLIANINAGTGVINLAAPPAYALGTASRVLSIPSNWQEQAPGEATGWRVLDRWIYDNFTKAVEP